MQFRACRMSQCGICSIESKWDVKDFEISASPALRTLTQRHGVMFEKFENVTQEGQLYRYLDHWSKLSSDFGILYVGAHGSPGSVSLTNKDVDLKQIASHMEKLEHGNKNCIIHFWSCATLGASETELNDFLSRTGFEAISGYRIDVGWIKPLAFELLYLGYLMGNAPRGKLTRGFMQETSFKLQEYAWYDLGSSMGFTIHPRQP